MGTGIVGTGMKMTGIVTGIVTGMAEFDSPGHSRQD